MGKTEAAWERISQRDAAIVARSISRVLESYAEILQVPAAGRGSRKKGDEVRLWIGESKERVEEGFRAHVIAELHREAPTLFRIDPKLGTCPLQVELRPSKWLVGMSRTVKRRRKLDICIVRACSHGKEGRRYRPTVVVELKATLTQNSKGQYTPRKLIEWLGGIASHTSCRALVAVADSRRSFAKNWNQTDLRFERLLRNRPSSRRKNPKNKHRRARDKGSVNFVKYQDAAQKETIGFLYAGLLSKECYCVGWPSSVL